MTQGLMELVASVPKLYRGLYERALTSKSRPPAMRAMCYACRGWEKDPAVQGGLHQQVKDCSVKDCPFRTPVKSRAEAIKEMCFRCSGGQSRSESDRDDIRNCKEAVCPLHNVRPYLPKCQKTGVKALNPPDFRPPAISEGSRTIPTPNGKNPGGSRVKRGK